MPESTELGPRSGGQWSLWCSERVEIGAGEIEVRGNRGRGIVTNGGEGRGHGKGRGSSQRSMVQYVHGGSRRGTAERPCMSVMVVMWMRCVSRW